MLVKSFDVHLLCLWLFSNWFFVSSQLCGSNNQMYGRFINCLNSRGLSRLISTCLGSSDFRSMKLKVCTSGESMRQSWQCLRSDSLWSQVKLCKEQAYTGANNQADSSSGESSMREYQFQANGQPIAVVEVIGDQVTSTTGITTTTSTTSSKTHGGHSGQSILPRIPSNSNSETKYKSSVGTSNNQIDSAFVSIQNGLSPNGLRL